MNKVEALLNRMNACREAKDWVQSLTVTTFEQGWRTCPEPAWLLQAIGYAGYEEAGSRRARKWVCQCLMLVHDYLHDPRSQRALTVLDAYSGGGSSADELTDALASAQGALDTR